MESIVLPDPAAIGARVAAEIVTGIRERATRPYVVGFPASRTSIPVAEAFVDAAHREQLDLSRLWVVMMDEYVEPDPEVGGTDGSTVRYRRIDPDLEHSCVGWGIRRLVEPLADLGLTPERLLAPDPADTARIAEQVRDLGGIDLFILASGQSDGHVALNPQGSGPDERCRVVELQPKTRADNVLTFPHLGDVSAVPSHGITLGTGDFVELCANVRMLVWGENKSLAFQHLSAADDYDPQWPATIVTRCQNPVLLADAAAAGTPADAG